MTNNILQNNNNNKNKNKLRLTRGRLFIGKVSIYKYYFIINILYWELGGSDFRMPKWGNIKQVHKIHWKLYGLIVIGGGNEIMDL